MSRRKNRDEPRRKLSEFPEDSANPEIDFSDSDAVREKIKDMQMEIDLLRATIDVIKKDHGVDSRHSLLNNREKAGIVDTCKDKYQTAKLLSWLGIARSSCYFSIRHPVQSDRYRSVREEIVRIFNENYCCYGYRRIKVALSKSGKQISEKVVRRLMKDEKLKVGSKQQRKYSSCQGEVTPAVPNVLERDFNAMSPNQKWVTDTSEFAIPAGKVYLSVIIDCFDGMVVADKASERPDAMLANSTLDLAVINHPSCTGAIVHSDRGAHYRWSGWIDRMQKYHLQISMSRKSCSPDNAACEGFFGRMKNECFHGRNFRGYTINEFMKYLDGYIRWYNESRIKISLGNRSPVEY